MLTREECLQILGLDETASFYDIENKYTKEIKINRNLDTDEARQRLDQVSLAYNILTGRYQAPVEIDPRLQKVVAGKSLDEWKTKFYYARWPLLAALLGLVFLIYLIASIVNNQPADFAVAIVGLYSDGGSAEDSLQSYLAEQTDGAVQHPDIHFIPIDFNSPIVNPDQTASSETGQMALPQHDPQSQYAYNMKLVTLLFSEQIDFFMINQAGFDRYASQGAFADLSGLYARLADLPADILTKIKPIYAVIEEDLAPEDQGQYDSDFLEAEAQLLGLDLTELDLFEGLDIWFGDEQIIALGYKSRDPGQSLAYLEAWIRDYQAMSSKAEYLASQQPQLD